MRDLHTPWREADARGTGELGFFGDGDGANPDTIVERSPPPGFPAGDAMTSSEDRVQQTQRAVRGDGPW